MIKKVICLMLFVIIKWKIYLSCCESLGVHLIHYLSESCFTEEVESEFVEWADDVHEVRFVSFVSHEFYIHHPNMLYKSSYRDCLLVKWMKLISVGILQIPCFLKFVDTGGGWTGYYFICSLFILITFNITKHLGSVPINSMYHLNFISLI